MKQCSSKTFLYVACMLFFFSTIIACDKKQPVIAEAQDYLDLDDEKVLNIYNWPDYLPDEKEGHGSFIARFESETGIRVNYDTFETNEALQVKLVAGNSGYDIVVPSTTFVPLQIQGGLLQPLNKSLIPNLSNLDPIFMDTMTKIDPENKYLVPWGWGFTTVGIDRAKVIKALGGELPMPENAWDLVFNPKYTKRLKSCGIMYLDSPTEILPVALHYIGKKAYSQNVKDYDLAANMLQQVRQDILQFSSVLIDDLASGRACAIIGWSGDINIASDRALENKMSNSIEALLPEGTLSFVDAMAITKYAKHPKNAAAFINYFLRADNAASMINHRKQPIGNKAALQFVKPEILNNKSVFVDDDYLNKMIEPEGFTHEAREAMAKVYNNFKEGIK